MNYLTYCIGVVSKVPIDTPRAIYRLFLHI